MIDLRLLEELKAFSDLGTLSAAAEKLHTSQPALSRSMKQLEEELGLTLFARSKNHLSLTETGVKAAEYAGLLLDQALDYEQKIKAYDRSLHTISVGFCAPVPQSVLMPLLSAEFPGMTLAFDMMDDEHFADQLGRKEYQLAVMHEAPSDERFYHKKCGHEDLYLSVVPQHPLAVKEKITLSDLDGLSLLLLTEIGFWTRMHQAKTPHTRYLHQYDRTVLNEIAVNSPYPTFASGFYIRRNETIPGRVYLPIVDPEAHTDYYLVCLASEKERFADLFRRIDARTIY